MSRIVSNRATPLENPQRSRLDEVARRYYAPLVRYFRKRASSREVHDLVQQVFLRLSESGDVQAIRNPDAYIFRTASNTLTDHWRRGDARRRMAADAQALVSGESDSTASPERVLLARESLARLVGAIRLLPERTRDVFILRCYEGLTHAEVARLQGISVRAVEKHFAKALSRIALALEGES
jgi:RNA polymerase sigma factor (sigma-70 family)